jgi:hypothetical protein
MAYLDDNPPVRSQFRLPRRTDPSGVIVAHTAENMPDFVAFDGGAEAVANFIRNRTDPGSYHELCDSDSAINLVRYDAEAYHDATGSNPHSFGVSAATRADVWPLAPEEWRNGCIRNMAARSANYARWCRTHYGIVIPARRITRAESEARVPGFISHAERDPERRTDPGRWFPWDQFLGDYELEMGSSAPTVPTPQEVLRTMSVDAVLTVPDDPERRTYLVLDHSGRRAYKITGQAGLTSKQWWVAGREAGLYPAVKAVSAETYDRALALVTQWGNDV